MSLAGSAARGAPRKAAGRNFDIAYEKLRERIVHGRLAPGTRVVEADIAQRLGISRTPVRSALHRLQQEGYVVAAPGARQARLTVAPLTKEDARELYWLVGHVEGLAGRLLAGRGEAERTKIVGELRERNRRLEELAQAGKAEPGTIFEVDMDFHRCLVESSAGPRLLALHAAIKPQTERYWRLYASAIMDDLGTSVAEHNGMIEAIERGDPDEAELAVRRNWENGAERLARVIDSLGERGRW